MPKAELVNVRNADINRAAKAINVALSRYTMRPELISRYGDRALFAWSPVSKNWKASADRVCTQPTAPRVTVVFAEAEAVKRIVELSHDGLIDRLRKCDCGTWFFAKFSHQKFCSDSCQKKTYKSSDEWKKYRREYMKRNRALHQQKLFRSTR